VALGLAMLSPLMLYSFLFVLSDGLFTLLCVAALLELPRRRIIPLALILCAAVLTKYAGLFLLVFVALWLIYHGRWQNAAFACFLPLTAFLGWVLRCYALYGKLTTTAPIARYSALESIGGTLVTVIQFGGVILGCVLIESLWRRLSSRTRYLSF
jgi:Gpi18-like mannosyltransferase